MKPSIERLHKLFAVRAADGALIRKITTSNRCPAGQRAGTLDKSTGYRRVRIDGKVYYEHIVVWAMTHGRWPSGLIDHKFGGRATNAPDNLRDASRAINQQNLRRARADSKTGVLGVLERDGRFRAHLRIKGRQTFLGVFDTADAAHAAYVEAKRIHHEGNTL